MSASGIVFQKIFAVALFVVMFFNVQKDTAGAIPDDKRTTEQILAKHLESIGTADARNAVTSIMAPEAPGPWFGAGAPERHRAPSFSRRKAR